MRAYLIGIRRQARHDFGQAPQDGVAEQGDVVWLGDALQPLVRDELEGAVGGEDEGGEQPWGVGALGGWVGGRMGGWVVRMMGDR